MLVSDRWEIHDWKLWLDMEYDRSWTGVTLTLLSLKKNPESNRINKKFERVIVKMNGEGCAFVAPAPDLFSQNHSFFFFFYHCQLGLSKVCWTVWKQYQIRGTVQYNSIPCIYILWYCLNDMDTTACNILHTLWSCIFVIWMCELWGFQLISVVENF